MWMTRSLLPGLCAAAVLAIAGCSQNGSYRLSWTFVVDQATGATESSATACGRYRVDSIQITGTDETGDAQQVVALCTPGWMTATAPDGTWTFVAQMFDAQGAPIVSSDPMMGRTNPEPISSEGAQAEFSVVLEPPPPQ
jgi:hypothetical protein